MHRDGGQGQVQDAKKAHRMDGRSAAGKDAVPGHRGHPRAEEERHEGRPRILGGNGLDGERVSDGKADGSRCRHTVDQQGIHHTGNRRLEQELGPACRGNSPFGEAAAEIDAQRAGQQQCHGNRIGQPLPADRSEEGQRALDRSVDGAQMRHGNQLGGELPQLRPGIGSFLCGQGSVKRRDEGALAGGDAGKREHQQGKAEDQHRDIGRHRNGGPCPQPADIQGGRTRAGSEDVPG